MYGKAGVQILLFAHLLIERNIISTNVALGEKIVFLYTDLFD